MAIVFKDTKAERVPLVKDAESGSPTTFYFRITPALKRQVWLNMMSKGTVELGLFLNDVFSRSLVGWDGLQDENGNDVPYSDKVRDWLINETDTFTATDVLEIFDFQMADGKTEPDGKKKTSTSKKR